LTSAPCGQDVGVVERDTSRAPSPPDEVETEVLLAQGDELLKSSRDLLDELDDVLPSAPPDAAAQ
jgi:hypothetical protein